MRSSRSPVALRRAHRAETASGARRLLTPGTAVRAVLAAAVLTAAALPYAGTALAAGSETGFDNLRVSPSPARPGGTVHLTTEACGGLGHATVDASALGAGRVVLRPEEHSRGGGTLHGSFRVAPGTAPGDHGIGGSCRDGRELTGTVVVGEGKDRDHHTMPHGRVHAGTGGGQETGTASLAGGALALTAAAGGAYYLRRRHVSRRS